MERIYMPTPQKYANNAERQSAYRRRRSSQLEGKLMPQISGTGVSRVSPASSYHRWHTMIRQSRSLLECVNEEMESYYHDRSELWQESERGDTFIETMELIEAVISLMEDLPQRNSTGE
jgi:hypothetical protein